MTSKRAIREECAICAETYTPKNQAICAYCEYKTCRTCVRQYVLLETEPKCMNCKKPWTREHQNEILKPIFVNGELKKHLEQVMFDRERAQLVATMEIVEQRRIAHKLSSERTIIQQELCVITTNLSLLTTKIRESKVYLRLAKTAPKMHPDIDANKLEQEISALSEEFARCDSEKTRKFQRYEFINRIFRLTPEQRRVVYENQIEGANPDEILHTIMAGTPGNAATKNGAAAKRHFVRACPVESCRGFLSTQWKCGLCEVFTCSTCHVPKSKDPDVGHVCNPDDVLTAELLAKDTKPCPKCGTGIFKIDGCDQMWCIECHSAFSWRTGALETGHVHNPHFFEYQRRMGTNTRNIMDLPCNAMNPDDYHGVIHHLLGRLFTNVAKNLRVTRRLEPIPTDAELKIRRKSIDVAMSIPVLAQLLNRYRHDAIQNHQELRIKYLTEEINEEQFRNNLFRESKKFNKEREFGQVLQTVVFAMTDILTRLVEYFRKSVNNVYLIDDDDLDDLEDEENSDKDNSDEEADEDEDDDDSTTDSQTENDNIDAANTTNTTNTTNATNTTNVTNTTNATKRGELLDHRKTLAILNEIDQLIDYANECLAKICAVYKVTRVGLFLRQSSGNNASNITYQAGLYSVIVKMGKDGKVTMHAKI